MNSLVTNAICLVCFYSISRLHKQKITSCTFISPQQQAYLDGMQCFKLAAVSPNPLVLPPSAEQLFSGHTPGDFMPACFSPDGMAADQGGQSPVLSAHLRLLAAGVPSLFQWDETTCKHTHLTFFTTAQTTPQADAEIKAVLSTPGLEGLYNRNHTHTSFHLFCSQFLVGSDGKHTVGLLGSRFSVSGIREPHRVVCLTPLRTKNNGADNLIPIHTGRCTAIRSSRLARRIFARPIRLNHTHTNTHRHFADEKP